MKFSSDSEQRLVVETRTRLVETFNSKWYIYPRPERSDTHAIVLYGKLSKKSRETAGSLCGRCNY